jgi:hypothetical protein
VSKQLKAKCWSLFSRYIRIKHADKDGICTCITCGVKKPWKELQAGHFIDSRNNSVLFDERLVFPQCVGCNMFKKGNKVKYTLFMLKKHTKKQVEEMYNLKFKTRKISDAEYLEMIDELKDKLVALDMGYKGGSVSPKKGMK